MCDQPVTDSPETLIATFLDLLPRLHGAALRILKNVHDADDITNDVFLEVVGSQKLTWRDTAHLEHQLLRFARYRSLDLLRRRRHGVDVPLEDVIRIESEDETGVDHQRAARAAEAAAKLSKKRSLATVARLVADGHSRKEIASILEVSEETVRRHMARIRTVLSDPGCTFRRP